MSAAQAYFAFDKDENAAADFLFNSYDNMSYNFPTEENSNKKEEKIEEENIDDEIYGNDKKEDKKDDKKDDKMEE
jgi:hypothetical protein